MNTHALQRPALGLSLVCAALLAACGGGGSDAGGSTNVVAQETAQAMSANSSALPEDGTETAETVMKTTQAMVQGVGASATYTCAGGGTASYTVTGPTAGTLGNGQFDAGEVYTATYIACRGAAGWAALNGTATLTVTQAGGGTTAVSTSTQNLSATLPLRTLTWNGTSTITQTVATAGTQTTTTTNWTSPGITLTSVRPSRTSTFTLSALNLTRTIVSDNGTIVSRTGQGTHTMNAVLPNAQWTVTTATQGAVTYDANGNPTAGAWTITLPNNTLSISAVPGTLTIAADFGSDGTIDRTWTFGTAQAAAEAG